ncbi:MAGE-domain-containing protein [Cryphonectria parasitica EP155]|uniref:MAGE-domain-containing protein n=1 Tax=Cryphonectria parasitica (strain ATCC 38755 / EP155) TaxID=660469 RepID=A0A9P5CSX6_CRYP1|nr:MAGE-domain-containing protein [Cryphonectria parasitica EP155]KAF3768816.1 MAGE-domain-containing protein [Cryphonectria parasitica EP155]
MPPSARRPRRAVDDEGEESDEEQRPRQRPRMVLDPTEHERSENYEEEEGDGEDETEDDALIRELVRYAMACDFARVPIRREGIKEKVLGRGNRSFRRIFQGAQERLRDVLGMEMVDLPVKEKLTKEDKRKGETIKSQSKIVPSNSYVLVSILPKAYKNPKILAPSRLISADEEAAYVGFYTLIVSLVRISGGEVSDSVLKRHLRRLNAETNAFADYKTEDILAKLQRQGYLVKTGDRQAQQHGQADSNTTWFIGPRGKVELDDEAVAGLIREVWGPVTDADANELEEKLANTLEIQAGQSNGDSVADAHEDENGLDSTSDTEENGGPSFRAPNRLTSPEEREY